LLPQRNPSNRTGFKHNWHWLTKHPVEFSKNKHRQKQPYRCLPYCILTILHCLAVLRAAPSGATPLSYTSGAPCQVSILRDLRGDQTAARFNRSEIGSWVTARSWQTGRLFQARPAPAGSLTLPGRLRVRNSPFRERLPHRPVVVGPSSAAVSAVLSGALRRGESYAVRDPGVKSGFHTRP